MGKKSTVEQLIERLEKIAADNRYSKEVRKAAARDSKGYRAVITKEAR